MFETITANPIGATAFLILLYMVYKIILDSIIIPLTIYLKIILRK